MPELPEVETIVNGIKSLVGQTIKQVITRQPSLRYVIDNVALNGVVNSQVIDIYRRAKYIIIQLTQRNIIIHLGMSGSLTFATSTLPLKKHDHVDIIFGEVILRYNDPRRFGCILVIDDIVSHKLFANLGPEPLTTAFNPLYLFKITRMRRVPIKQLIMDNFVVVGVGNIYANEALFMSKINPICPSMRLTQSQCNLLVKNIKQVLIKAIASGGSSLRDYQHADGSLGYFQDTHLVYNKLNKPCVNCCSLIQAIRIGQRNSFYCPICQE